MHDLIVHDARRALYRGYCRLSIYIHPIRELGKLIGKSTVVALGEVSHGSSEIEKTKAEIVRCLASNGGFSTFVLEANLPESHKFNNYILYGEDDPIKLLAGLKLWPWYTQEMLSLVESMRQIKTNIQFNGIDMQFCNSALDILCTAFQGDNEAEADIRELKKAVDDRFRMMVRSQKVDSTHVSRFNTIELAVGKHIERLELPNKEWLRRCLEVTKQCWGMSGALDIGWRDRCMADNFMWIRAQNPNSKFVIWAHNTHIMRQPHNLFKYAVMGNYLADELGNDYASVGFTFGSGAFTATKEFLTVGSFLLPENKGLATFQAPPVYPGSLEFLLEQINEPIYIIDLKSILHSKNKHTQWLREPIDYRAVGAVATGNNEEFNHQRVVSNDFDYLIFIRTSTPTTLLTPINSKI